MRTLFLVRDVVPLFLILAFGALLGCEKNTEPFVYIPNKTGKKVPALIVLNTDGNTKDQFERFRPLAEQLGWVLVGDRVNQKNQNFDVSVLALGKNIRDVVSKYPVDPSRVYLAAYSGAVMTTYEFLLANPELLGGIIAQNGILPFGFSTSEPERVLPSSFPSGLRIVLLPEKSDSRRKLMSRDKLILEDIGWQTLLKEYEATDGLYADNESLLRAMRWLDQPKAEGIANEFIDCPEGYDLRQKEIEFVMFQWCENAKKEFAGPCTSWTQSNNSDYRNSMHRKRTMFRNGVLDGAVKQWENGVMTEKTNYSNGKKHGASTEWFGTQMLKHQFYENGLENGMSKQWSKTGLLLGTYEMKSGNGTFVEWHDNGQPYLKGDIVDGKKEGVWTRYNTSGKKLGEYTLTKGVGTIKNWNNDGWLSTEMILTDDPGFYTLTFFHKDGRKKMESLFNATFPGGRTRVWDTNGKMVKEKVTKKSMVPEECI